MSGNGKEEDVVIKPKRALSEISNGHRIGAKLKKMELEHKRSIASLESSYMKQIRQCEADIQFQQATMEDDAINNQKLLAIPIEERSVFENQILEQILGQEHSLVFKIKLERQRIENLKTELEADKKTADTDFNLQIEIVKQDDDDAGSQRLSSDDEDEVKSQTSGDQNMPKKKKASPSDVDDDDDSSESEDDDLDEESKKMTRMMKIMGKTLGKAMKLNQKKEKIIVNSNVDKDLPTYDGTPEQWISFKCQYERTTKKHKFDDSDNLYRLQKALKGKAMEAVKYLFNTPDNVNQIMKNLEMEFGRPELIIESLIKTAESAENPNLSKPETMVSFARCVQSLVVSIKGHKQDDYLNNIHLLNKLTEKLPPQLRREWIQWYRSQPKQVKNMESFEEWISIQKEMACEMVKVNVTDNTEERGSSSRRRRGPGSINSGVAESEEKTTCSFCKKNNHTLDTCRGFKKISLNDKWSFVKAERVCFCCLKGKHLVRNCPNNKQCGKDNCDKFHNRILHAEKNQQKVRPPPPPPNDELPDNDIDGIAGVTLIEGADGPLGIVPVKIRGPNGVRKTFALLDSGATSSFIDGKLAADLGITGAKKNYTVSGIMGNVIHRTVECVNFDIAGIYKGASYNKMTEVNAVGNLGFRPYSVNVEEIKKKWPHLKKIKMDNLKNAVVEVLIGEDHGFITMQREVLFKDESAPVGKRTKLGWFVSGKIREDGTSGRMYHVCGSDEYLHQLIKDSFSVDNFGVRPTIEDTTASIEDRRSLRILEETYKKESGKCEVGLLWRNPDVTLPESKPAALRRLMGIEKKMAKDPQFADMYCNKFREYENKGYIRKLHKQQISTHSPREWYVPHFGVTNSNKPGKLRLVFDAAAKSNGVALNDNLMKGPDLIRPLTEVLWNFRKHPFVINGDIEDMFHRVGIREEDRSSQRFLWRDGDTTRDPDVYEMNVMIFGASSSPASAIFTKNKNAEEFQERYPDAYRAICEDFYVDDVLTGDNTVEKTVKLYNDIVNIHHSGNFNVTKWTSNSLEVLCHIPEEMRAVGARNFGSTSTATSERVLGLWWDPTDDCFTFRANFHKVREEILLGGRPTKREMTSLVMSLYDPLGFIGHFKVKGMMLLQQAWRDKIGWDDEITDELYEDWKPWVKDVPSIELISVPRCYCYDLQNADSVQLHVFVDASLEAYCAVCYLRISVGKNTSLSFVASKVRVAPLKKLTVPRMELMAALLGTRLATAIECGLKIEITSRYFWSDSRTVLSWIRTEVARFKEFVANRIGDIQEGTNPQEWKWIPSDLNVADDGTRLHKPTDFSPGSRWLNGPNFLLLDSSKWPEENKSVAIVAVHFDGVLLEDNVNTRDVAWESMLPNLERFSSFIRLIRATAAVIAALKWWSFGKKSGMKSPWSSSSSTSSLSCEDLQKAEELQVKSIQKIVYAEDIKLLKACGPLRKSKLRKLSPVLDENGIIRLRGRIDRASVIEAAKRPAILPSRHHFTELLILHEHEMNAHQGQSTVLNNLRQRYWIVEGRAAVKRVFQRCQQCRNKSVKPVVPEMGSLPQYRLASYQPPFTFTGVDFFGPMEVTVGRHREKRWGALFVCMVTRAIHLEVAHGLSTDEMMLVFSRFVDCRGRPCHMYSDNGTNFVGTKKELKEALKYIDFSRIAGMRKFQSIQWRFIPPASPHMGGSWERMVQCVKKSLSQVLKEHPKDPTLMTALKAVENIVNSRPLTYVSTDPDDPESLTPNHFLRGRSDIGPSIPVSLNDSDAFGRKQWKIAQRLANKFWERWTHEYLPELIRRQKWHEKMEPIRVGDIVVVVDDLAPRNTWIKAVVTAVFPGKDGQVRVVEVTTRDFGTKKTSTYRRPVSKICQLGLKIDSGTLPQIGGRNVGTRKNRSPSSATKAPTLHATAMRSDASSSKEEAEKRRQDSDG